MTLKQFREKKGLSQAKLGLKVGLKQTTISQYENGKRKPNLAMSKRLADALDVSLDDIFCSLTFKNEIQENYTNDLNEILENLEELEQVTRRLKTLVKKNL